MRMSSRIQRASLVLSAQALLLSGCGYGQSLLPDSAQSKGPNASQIAETGIREVRTTQVHGEAFKAFRVQVVPLRCLGTRNSSATFKASGKATGPFPGTFTAAGSWLNVSIPRYQGWSFSESFTITSGGNTVIGSISGSGHTPPNRITCHQFGATSALQYTSNDGSGAATTTGIAEGSLGESLL
jgi:hypothetical protein